MARLSLGIDVGGTFTDFVVYDPEANYFSVGKHLTTPDNPSVGVIAGTQEILQRLRVATSDLSHIVHGTTLVSNLLIQRKGTKVGLIATEGFRDALELGREQRYDMYDLFIKRAEPLVPRYLRRAVSERVDWEGKVLRPLKLEEVDPIVRLFQEEQVESIAVVLMHSYRNPAHEQRIRDYLKDRYPRFYVTISSEVAPEVREHQRNSTTVANAYVQPAMDRYLGELDAPLKERGFRGTIYIMLSGGGVTTVDVAREVPIRMVESGPAAGAIASTYYANLLGQKDVISFDMGGTTAKICLITNGHPSRTSELEVAREHRFKKGSGLVLKVPAIDMIEIGAGGGSIANIDVMGLMKVGPQSAGADPGPACYGLGGSEPTVTDADLLLGYLDPNYFLGGRDAPGLGGRPRGHQPEAGQAPGDGRDPGSSGHPRCGQREYGHRRPHLRLRGGSGRPPLRLGGLWGRRPDPCVPTGQAATHQQGDLPPGGGSHLLSGPAGGAQVL